MICAIHQPQFIPWLGYLDKVAKADMFIFLDDVQFKKNEYQNRNRILTISQGPQWLTVPVSFHYGDAINQVRVPTDMRWRQKMLRTVAQNYGKALGFNDLYPAWERLISDSSWQSLGELNTATVLWLMDLLDIRTPVHQASELGPVSAEPTQRLIDLCVRVKADTYLSGAGGRDYLRVEEFSRHGLQLEFQHYEHPVYPQRPGGGEFVSHLSALDMVMWGTRRLPAAGAEGSPRGV